MRPAWRGALVASIALVLATLPAAAQEPCPCPPEEEAPEPLWQTKVGLSYVATSGNTETTTLGSDLRVTRRPAPWGFEILASYDRAEDSSELQSERTLVGVRGKRALNERWDLFGEVTGEQDEFAGFELRMVITTGATLHALLGPRHLLDLDLGGSWTDEDRVFEEGDVSFGGGLIGMKYTWVISERAELAQRLAWFPNFEDSGAWRLESFTTLEAALNERLALRLGYEVRFHNAPIGERDHTDTTTRMSVVVNF